MRLLDRFKQRPERRVQDSPAPAVNVYHGKSELITIDHRHVYTAKRAMQHPVVFRCVVKIALSVATVRWIAEADPKVTGRVAAPVSAIKAVQDVLDYPTDDHTPDMMRFWMALNFALFSRFGVKVGINTSGFPNAIYPLVPGQLKAVTDKRGRITSYKYGNGNDAVNFITRRDATSGGKLDARPDKAYAQEIMLPNLSADPTVADNMSVLGPISKPATIISMLLERAYETAAGTPNVRYILTGDKQLTKKQETMIEEFLYSAAVGGENSGNVLSLFNTGLEVHEINNDLSDVHTKIPADDMARHIASVFGIPISMLGLGAADASKFANNYAEGRLAFYQDTIIPGYCTPIASGLTASICPPGVRVRFEVDDIPALRQARAERAKELQGTTFLTVNEKREMVGYGPVPDGDVLDVNSVAPSVPVDSTT